MDQVLIGLLLSDGSLERPSKTGGVRLSVVLGIDTEPYLIHLFELFESLIDSKIQYLDVKDKNTGKVYSTVRFKTPLLPVFVYYYQIFYV